MTMINTKQGTMDVDKINVAHTRINGQYTWFICDEHGRKIKGTTEKFDTMIESTLDFYRNGPAMNATLTFVEQN